MKILLLSQESSILNENSPTRAKILEYSSFVDTLFVVVTIDLKGDEKETKQITPNTWIYKTYSPFKFLQVYKIFKRASFEINIKNYFQADIIICDGQLIGTLAGYLLAKKFKRPLYVVISESTEKKYFSPMGFKNKIISKILWFILKKSDYIKVENSQSIEKLLKKSPLLKVEAIKPFIDANEILLNYKNIIGEEKTKRNLIREKFSQLRFTAVSFVDNVDQAKISLEILGILNTHFPPSSLVLLYSENINKNKINSLIRDELKQFVCVETAENNLNDYLIDSNVFWGISKGEKYEEILNKACILGSKIIAIESDVSKKLIDDNTTGFICPVIDKQETLNYFNTKTLLLMSNPSIGLGFKINMPISFKKQFTETKESYLNKLKSSLEKCLEEYKKTHAKHYEF